MPTKKEVERNKNFSNKLWQQKIQNNSKRIRDCDHLVVRNTNYYQYQYGNEIQLNKNGVDCHIKGRNTIYNIVYLIGLVKEHFDEEGHDC